MRLILYLTGQCFVTSLRNSQLTGNDFETVCNHGLTTLCDIGACDDCSLIPLSTEYTSHNYSGAFTTYPRSIAYTLTSEFIAYITCIDYFDHGVSTNSILGVKARICR